MVAGRPAISSALYGWQLFITGVRGVLQFCRAASGAINGRKGTNWGHGGGWADNNSGSFPDELEISFSGNKTIDEVDLFTLQDNCGSPTEPTESMIFNTYGVSDFKVMYLNGSTWVDVPGATVTGNTNVWRKLTFQPVTTNKIKVVINDAIDHGYTRITEVEAWSPTPSGGASANINWLVADQLGTPRMIFDKTGSLANVKRHDYLPFGEELVAGQGLRTSGANGLGYAADNVRQKFTSKERDNETGLDYFLARFYSSTQGRFTSPDNFDGNPFHLLNEADQSSSLPYAILFDPQTLNAYSYVYNNPLSFVDHDGHQGGRKIQLPGNPRYQIRADIRNPNDAPNIHVFDKGGRREIGRVAIKPGGNEWDGKVPGGVKAAVEKFIRDNGIQPRLPGAQPRPGAAAPEPEVGGTRVLRGTSNVISILAFITGAMNEVQNQREADRNGYHSNYQGQLVITDLGKTAQNFPAHSALDFGGHYWVPQGNTFVPLDNCDCTLEQDRTGKLHVVYKGD